LILFSVRLTALLTRLCLQPSAPHRDLHSFPTRRSSDLIGLSKLPRNSSPVRLKNRDAIDGRPHAYMRKFGMSRLNFRKLAHAGQDRKSTRLNSSHVSISYAVFCLKKKNKPIRLHSL